MLTIEVVAIQGAPPPVPISARFGDGRRFDRPRFGVHVGAAGR